MEIKVLGPGCAKCKKTEQMVLEVIKETGADAQVEKVTDMMKIASYGVFSTGINIKNLHNVIFASPSKSRVRNLQSIGRVLRKGNNKTKAMLYDIADDSTKNSRKNYTLNHLIERIKVYNEEKLHYEILNINLR